MNGSSYAMLLGVGLPATLLLSGSTVLFCRERTLFSLMQLFGAGFLTLLVITHVFETMRLLRWFNWGLESSIGHYVNFCSAVLGLTFFPLGYFLDALGRRQS